MDPAWLTALVALTAAVVGLISWAFRWAWRILRQVARFLDDWRGEPAHDGLPAKPGIVARLTSVEEALAHVVAETRPNHGKSLRDIVVSAQKDIATIKDDQAAMRARMELFETQRSDRED